MSVHSFFKGIAEYVTPVLKTSHFQEKGVLTPEEFVLCGDLLVFKCPTWSWEAGDPEKAKPFLPKDKQFLVTRNVPCLRRARALDLAAKDEEILEAEDGEGGWAAPIHTEGSKDTEVMDMSEATKGKEPAAPSALEGVENDEEDIPDMDDFQAEDNVVQADEATLDVGAQGSSSDENILRTRTYDVTITYDKYYQTPRVWLFGYDESRRPLTSNEILEDIYADYANKTVTIETHPHLGVSYASIHPCRHAEVMKKMIDRLAEEGKFVRVDLYLFLFLKFIQAVIPTIEYDFTIGVDASAGRSSS